MNFASFIHLHFWDLGQFNSLYYPYKLYVIPFFDHFGIFTVQIRLGTFWDCPQLLSAFNYNFPNWLGILLVRKVRLVLFEQVSSSSAAGCCPRLSRWVLPASWRTYLVTVKHTFTIYWKFLLVWNCLITSSWGVNPKYWSCIFINLFKWFFSCPCFNWLR